MEKKLLQKKWINPLERQKRESRRIFTENEEDAIAEYIWSNKIKPSKCFNDED